MKRGSQKQAASGLLSEGASESVYWEGAPDRDEEKLGEYTGDDEHRARWEAGHGKARVKVKELNEITKNRIKGEMRREH